MTVLIEQSKTFLSVEGGSGHTAFGYISIWFHATNVKSCDSSPTPCGEACAVRYVQGRFAPLQ